MSKNPKAKASDKKKAAQDLEITVKSVMLYNHRVENQAVNFVLHDDVQVVDAILKLGHEEKDANGGGTICSILKIKAYFIGKILLTTEIIKSWLSNVVHVQKMIQKRTQSSSVFS